jgi:hypothetical protein
VTLVEVAEKAKRYQRFARACWDRPFGLWYAFNEHGCVIAARRGAVVLAKEDVAAADWVFIKKEETR